VTTGDSNADYYDQGTNSADTEAPTTAEWAQDGHFVGSAVAGVQTGDVIIMEAWYYIDTNNASTATYSFFYDGGTVTTGTSVGTTVSDHASYLETPENLTFQAVVAGVTRPYHSYTDTGFWPSVGARTF
jgi:hypothetical protein